MTAMNALPATTAEYTSAITARLTAALSPSQLEVIDESADHAGHVGANAEGFGSHVRVRIASPQFDGISRVAKHRLVYHAMQNFIDDGLHALAIDII
jgi:BolA family transcriptional regulator, general stress-responsive regulator